MIKVKQSLIAMAAVLVTTVLVTSGCATKKYVQSQVNPVNQKLGQFEKKTNDQISYLNTQRQRDMSAVNERFDTTDQKLADVSNAVQQAQGTASRAMDETESNRNKIAATSTAVDTLASGVANALNFQPVENADVFFALNQSTLTPQAKVALDQVAQKALAQPRAVVELHGFTDRTGSAQHNLDLSRRRVWAVQRYLVQQKVPIRNIHVIGMGMEAPPPGLEAEVLAMNPHATRREINRAARRVRIQVFGAGDITQVNPNTGE
jgi:outer membrane protein OmpA-like peptidoglycan-associated protein